MKKIITLTLLLLGSTGTFASPTRLMGNNGYLYVDIDNTDGRLTYAVGYQSVNKRDTSYIQLLEPSPLGLNTSAGDWTQGLTLNGVSGGRGTFRTSYHLRQGKQSDIKKVGARYIADVACGLDSKNRFQVEFVLLDNDIAFRYIIPQQGQTSAIVVNGEATGFDFPSGTSAFICPQSHAMIGWMRSKPSYEEGYIWDAPATSRSQYGHGWTFPCLFRVPSKGLVGGSSSADNNWVLISETGVSSDYCASHLSDATPEGLFTIAFPMEDENNGFGSTGAQMGLATEKVTPNPVGRTPWRTITIGQTLAPIVETTIAWDVVEQLYEPSIDYQGSRNTWSWIIWQDASINFDDQVTYINLAADLGWEGCLIDGGWYEHIGREGMEKLFAYCKEKGVRPWVWYNSNGGWNDAPQCARQCMHNPIVRKKEMKWLHDGGVAGIKVDFFAGDKQETMRLYEGILSDANDYGIQVIFHGCTLPRGWERMYPNYCSSEAVLASENLYFSQGFCDMEARHACLHPFVRNTTASMEYGGTVLQRRLHREPGKGNTRRTSDIFELATAIAFQSSGQNFALTPRDLVEQPSFEIDFMKQVPTTWDETRYLDGYPGKYVVLARRHADRWYIAAMNAEEHAKHLTIDLSVLGGSAAGSLTTLLHDGPDGQTPQQSPLTTDKKGKVQLTLQPQCAAVIF